MGRDRFAEALADAREQIRVLRTALDAAGAARAQNLRNSAEKDAAPPSPGEKDAAPSSPRTLTFGTFSADPSQTPPLPSPTPSPPPPPAAAPAPRRKIRFDAALAPPPAVAYAPPPASVLQAQCKGSASFLARQLVASLHRVLDTSLASHRQQAALLASSHAELALWRLLLCVAPRERADRYVTDRADRSSGRRGR